MVVSYSTPIIDELRNFILSNGIPFSRWYIGITANPRDRLFSSHNVHETLDTWKYLNVGSNALARKIERYFIQVFGCDGGTGGGNNDAVFIYVYKKSYRTKQ